VIGGRGTGKSLRDTSWKRNKEAGEQRQRKSP